MDTPKKVVRIGLIIIPPNEVAETYSPDYAEGWSVGYAVGRTDYDNRKIPSMPRVMLNNNLWEILQKFTMFGGTVDVSQDTLALFLQLIADNPNELIKLFEGEYKCYKLQEELDGLTAYCSELNGKLQAEERRTVQLSGDNAVLRSEVEKWKIDHIAAETLRHTANEELKTAKAEIARLNMELSAVRSVYENKIKRYTQQIEELTAEKTKTAELLSEKTKGLTEYHKRRAENKANGVKMVYKNTKATALADAICTAVGVDGHTYDEVCEQFDISTNTVSKVLKENGINSRKRGYYVKTDQGYVLDEKRIAEEEAERIAEERAKQERLERKIKAGVQKELQERAKSKKSSRNDRIFNLFNEGKTAVEIAKVMRISVDTVRRVLRSENLIPPVKHRDENPSENG